MCSMRRKGPGSQTKCQATCMCSMRRKGPGSQTKCQATCMCSMRRKGWQPDQVPGYMYVLNEKERAWQPDQVPGYMYVLNEKERAWQPDQVPGYVLSEKERVTARLSARVCIYMYIPPFELLCEDLQCLSGLCALPDDQGLPHGRHGWVLRRLHGKHGVIQALQRLGKLDTSTNSTLSLRCLMQTLYTAHWSKIHWLQTRQYYVHGN